MELPSKHSTASATKNNYLHLYLNTQREVSEVNILVGVFVYVRAENDAILTVRMEHASFVQYWYNLRKRFYTFSDN